MGSLPAHIHIAIRLLCHVHPYPHWICLARDRLARVLQHHGHLPADRCSCSTSEQIKGLVMPFALQKLRVGAVLDTDEAGIWLAYLGGIAGFVWGIRKL